MNKIINLVNMQQILIFFEIFLKKSSDSLKHLWWKLIDNSGILCIQCQTYWNLRQDIDIFEPEWFSWEERNSLNENFTDFKLRIYQVCEA